MDRRVINLNAFGEEVLPKESERKFFADDSDDEYIRTEERPFRKIVDESPKHKYETVFKNILQNISQAKLLHWQTPKYAQHKALDELFDLHDDDDFIDGDMADKKYTEEDLMSAFNAGINNDYGNGPSFDKWLNSLNKQD
jgi:hypothetical protein